MGTDPLDAQAVARGVAEKIGGVVFPTLYCGTERARTPQELRCMGFEDDDLYVVGMDVPATSVKSCYFPEEAFGMILREYLLRIVEQRFRLVVVVNGHGASGQLAAGERLAKEFTHTTPATVLFTRAMQKLEEDDQRLGHANISETSMQMYISGDSVDLDKLPAPGGAAENLRVGHRRRAGISGPRQRRPHGGAGPAGRHRAAGAPLCGERHRAHLGPGAGGLCGAAPAAGEEQMIANYHTHTARCLHAAGAEREYVERALQGGCRVLGFSDHTPYPFPAPYVSGFRMRMDQLEGYVRTVLDLRAAYRGEIEIRLGLEVEYYPRYFEQLLRAVEGYPSNIFCWGSTICRMKWARPTAAHLPGTRAF